MRAKGVFAILLLATLSSVSGKKVYRREVSKDPIPTEAKDSIPIETLSSSNLELLTTLFVFDTTQTITIPPKDQIEFEVTYDNASKEGSLYVFYVGLKTDSVHFKVLDRSDNSALFQSKLPDLGVKISPKKKEVLQVSFRNPSSSNHMNVVVSFGCEGCQTSTQAASKKHVDLSLAKLKNINHHRTKMYFISQVYKEKQAQYLNNVKNSHERLWAFSIIEIFMLSIVSIVQIFVIKKLLGKHGIL